MTIICKGEKWAEIEGTNFRVGSRRLHVRFCSTDQRRSSHYKFNINRATLRADFEVWICGGPDVYYLLPVAVMQRIYDDPRAYVDARHPDIRVVSVDTTRHIAVYAQGSQKLALNAYFRKTLVTSVGDPAD